MSKGLFLVMAILVLAVPLGAFAFQNEPDGFRGLKWGDPPGEDMVFHGDAGLVRNYRLPGDKMALGDAKFYRILYAFYLERFLGIVLYFKGQDNYDLLEMICKEQFGKGGSFHSIEGWERIGWGGQTTGILLWFNSVEKEGYLWVGSTLISQEMQATQSKKEAEKAAEDW